MNSERGRQKLFRRLVPPLVGVVLLLLFVKLGFWQLDRADQKIEMQQAFDKPASHIQVAAKLAPERFQPIKTRGRYLNRQVVIENIVVDGALGYYVITPLEYNSGALLLVNRGWVRRGPQESLADITVEESARLVLGKTGHLPRVGIRPGEAFRDHSHWPRAAVWPTADEIARELGREVLPFVLLLDPGQEDGFVRHWMPKQAGASTHYGYAFQWFAMATALLLIMGWNLRRGVKDHDS